MIQRQILNVNSSKHTVVSAIFVVIGIVSDHEVMYYSCSWRMEQRIAFHYITYIKQNFMFYASNIANIDKCLSSKKEKEHFYFW